MPALAPGQAQGSRTQQERGRPGAGSAPVLAGRQAQGSPAQRERGRPAGGSAPALAGGEAQGSPRPEERGRPAGGSVPALAPEQAQGSPAPCQGSEVACLQDMCTRESRLKIWPLAVVLSLWACVSTIHAENRL